LLVADPKGRPSTHVRSFASSVATHAHLPARLPACLLQHALEWCLVVQEALMWQRWSSTVLSYPAFAEVLDAQHEVVFRGPRWVGGRGGGGAGGGCSEDPGG
jgi:hypothetical protein